MKKALAICWNFYVRNIPLYHYRKHQGQTFGKHFQLFTPPRLADLVIIKKICNFYAFCLKKSDEMSMKESENN